MCSLILPNSCPLMISITAVNQGLETAARTTLEPSATEKHPSQLRLRYVERMGCMESIGCMGRFEYSIERLQVVVHISTSFWRSGATRSDFLASVRLQACPLIQCHPYLTSLVSRLVVIQRTLTSKSPYLRFRSVPLSYVLSRHGGSELTSYLWRGKVGSRSAS